jgi:cytochrome c biogenesis protein CcmG, thiol:disulfide interchange protein DsbE
MKKGVLITLGIIGLLAVMVWADHKFPAPGLPSPNSTSTPPTDAPTVALKDLNGKDVTLQQYKGDVVLVNFWATWCDPCKSEIPELIGLQQKYGPRGFEILGLSMDEDGKKAVQPFLDKERFDVDGQKEAINYPIVFANDTIAEKFGGVMGLPTSLLFTRDGKEIKRIVGPVDLRDISKDIENLL